MLPTIGFLNTLLFRGRGNHTIRIKYLKNKKFDVIPFLIYIIIV